MSVTINIAGVDRTTKVEYNSFSLNRALTSQVDTIRFNIIKNPTNTYKPSLLDSVEVIEDSTVIFGGQIIEIDENVEGKDMEVIQVQAKDYTYDMDRNLVVNTYEDMSVDAIISDIFTNVLPSGYNIDNVSCPTLVHYIAFNYEYPSKCFQQLAELTGYDWYVDGSKNIYFFSKTSIDAPFALTDTSGNYYYNSLIIKKDIKNLRNTIIVRGGTYLGDFTSETVVSDGQALIYKQGYQYSNVTVTVNGVGQTVGIDNIDEDTGFDCLYNFQEKFVRFKVSTKPAASVNVVVGGNPHIPVIVKVKDPVSTALYGIYEYKIVDKSIKSKQGARDRAKAEISAWADTVNDGTFETNVGGLEVGQKINITSTIRSISQDYVISRISTKLMNGREFEHTVTLMTNQTYGMIEFLQKLLINKDKEIEIKAGEVLDEVESVIEEITVADGDAVVASKVHNPQTETITFGEVATAQTLNYGVQFVLGPQLPSGFKRQFILDGSRMI